MNFNGQGKLNVLGCLLIKDLFNRRGQHKKHNDSSTSNLYETCNLHIETREDENTIIYIETIENEQKDEFDKLNDVISKEDFDVMLRDLYAKDWFMHDVFTITNSKPINQLSKETTINRKYLTDCRKQAQTFLKNHEQLKSKI